MQLVAIEDFFKKKFAAIEGTVSGEVDIYMQLVNTLEVSFSLSLYFIDWINYDEWTAL